MNELELVKPSYLANINPLENENPVEMGDVKKPYLVIAQSNSKALLEDDPGYIDGLKPGYFYNSSNRKVYGKNVTLQFIHYFKSYNIYKGEEWKESIPENVFVTLRNRVFDPKVGITTTDYPDCNIKESWIFVVKVIEDDEFDFVFFSIKAGGISDAKNWLSKIQNIYRRGGASESVLWNVTTYLKESKVVSSKSYQIDGEKVVQSGFVDERTYKNAKIIKDQLKKATSDATHLADEY